MRLARSPWASSGADAERDILGDRQRLEQREMLEHHADAVRARFRRLLRPVGLAVEVHGAAVGLQHAVDHLHQRRLAGAVLAEQRVDLAMADGEGDVVVGLDARKALREAFEKQKRMIAGLGHDALASVALDRLLQPCGLDQLQQLRDGRNRDGRGLLAGDTADADRAR